MKDILVAAIGGIATVTAAIVGAAWFTPDLLRLDVFFPTKEVKILDDFIFANIEAYSEQLEGKPIEKYKNPYTSSIEDVFDRATYVEHIWLRKTNSSYTIRLTTSGAAPEVKAIDPELKNKRFEVSASGRKTMTADLAMDQSPEFKYTGNTPNPKTVYVYRNGFQGRNSWGGKNVEYDTDHLTFVYNFSSLPNYKNIFQVAPQACLKRAQGDDISELPIKWKDGVAIVESFSLNKGDKVRIFWTWNRLIKDGKSFEDVTCNDAVK